MLDLSPTKLLIIFVVVVVLLGPKRLPEVARQLGAGWRKLRDFSSRVDHELRQTVPDLPSSQDIVRFARSPITLLNQLADRTGESSAGAAQEGHGDALDVEVAADAAARGGAVGLAAGNGTGGTRPPAKARTDGGRGPSPDPAPSFAALDTDDPNLN